MSFEFNNNTPLYLQIVNIIAKEIVSGIINPGDKIPSVREYALIFKVNPNTICKALLLLEDEKLIYTERTNGKFVTKEIDIINKYKEKYIDEKVKNFVEELKILGFSKEDIVSKILEDK